MNKRHIVTLALASVGLCAAAATAGGIAEAASCKGPFQTNWFGSSSCNTFPGSGLGFARGISNNGSVPNGNNPNLRIQANLTGTVAGGSTDRLQGEGFNSSNSTAEGPLGFCFVIDTNPSPGSTATSSTNRCNTAVKHRALATF